MQIIDCYRPPWDRPRLWVQPQITFGIGAVDSGAVQTVIWRAGIGASIGALSAVAFGGDVRKRAAFGALIGIVFARWMGR